MSGALLPAGTAAFVERRLTPAPERRPATDPVDWVRGELGEHPWSVQRQIMRSVVENRRTLVPSCHGSGKSYIASRIAAWWMARHGSDAFLVTTAPTDRQVRAILWRELSRAHRKGALAGRITLGAEWYMGPKGAEELVGWGRKPQDLTDPEAAMQAFQGIHALHVLVVLDEATGVPKWLWDAADSLLTNDNARLLAIGNPDDPQSQFAEEVKPAHGARVIPISAFDTPNLTGEPVPDYVRDLLVGRTWVEERAEKWGRTSPLYVSKVLGRFPDTSDNMTVTPALVTAAWNRDLPGIGAGRYGLDVARLGSDESVLYRVRDGVARLVAKWAKQDTVATTRRVLQLTAANPHVPLVVDADGIGASVYDNLRNGAIDDGWRPAVPFTVNMPARDGRRFDSRRSEVWWEFREMMENGLVDLDPEDEDLAAQLQRPRWWLLPKTGQIHVESKKEMAKRGVASPDHADAVIMAAVHGPTTVATRGGRRGGHNGGGATLGGEVAELRRRQW